VLQPDTLLNDRYRLLEPIGEGGMATVYRAVDTRLGRSVAIKVLHPEYARDAPFVQRFQQEAEFAASLGAHPNIVAIYDIGQDGGLHYIVMELVEGRSLKDIMRERGIIPVDEAFAIGRQVALALDFAHKRGLIHRDVKPQNIMVSPEGVAKVTDFGIARTAAASQLTRPGMVMGTVHYFSPEQAQGKPATPASDIYSLGIILYEMLTGHLPFDADTPIGVAMQHLHSQPPPPWDYNPDLPTRAAATVMRALEKDPARRYRDAAELAQALSDRPAADAGGTTTVSPIVPAPRQQTAAYAPLEPTAVAPLRPAARPTVARPLEPPPPNRWRTAWIGLAAVLAAGIILVASFAFTNRFLLGARSTPTATPTSTPRPTATPKPKRRAPTATAPVVAPLPTSTFAPPTVTATAPPPTFTPKPLPPTFTPAPPKPTSTPPQPTVTAQGPLPLVTDTPTG
jgi:serine/threonine-protein kinase